MINLTWQLFPINGSYYDPRVTGLITAIVAAAVAIVWGPECWLDTEMPDGHWLLRSDRVAPSQHL